MTAKYFLSSSSLCCLSTAAPILLMWCILCVFNCSYGRFGCCIALRSCDMFWTKCLCRPGKPILCKDMPLIWVHKCTVPTETLHQMVTIMICSGQCHGYISRCTNHFGLYHNVYFCNVCNGYRTEAQSHGKHGTTAEITAFCNGFCPPTWPHGCAWYVARYNGLKSHVTISRTTRGPIPCGASAASAKPSAQARELIHANVAAIDPPCSASISMFMQPDLHSCSSVPVQNLRRDVAIEPCQRISTYRQRAFPWTQNQNTRLSVSRSKG